MSALYANPRQPLIDNETYFVWPLENLLYLHCPAKLNPSFPQGLYNHGARVT